MKIKKLVSPKKETKPKVKNATLILSIILIIIMGFTVYGNSLKGAFVWDDEILIKENIYIKSWPKMTMLFTKDIAAGAGSKLNLYRPLQILTYMLDYSMWKLNVIGYHLTNTIVHILVGICIFWLIYLLFGDRLLSFLTSIFFVAHPIHTEAVSYISGRSDSLAFLFVLLCFILYTKNKAYLLMLLCYVLALFSKESSLILPVLLLLYHFTFRKKVSVRKFLPILVITSIYIPLRLIILSSPLPHMASCTTVLQRLPGFFVAITDYIRLLFLPFDLHMEYGNKLFEFNHPKAILGITILSFLLIYAIRKRKRKTLIFFSITWFFIALLPQSNIYPLIIAYMAEHWLYVPSLGFFLILAGTLSSLYRAKDTRILSIILIIGLLGFYSFLTIRQNSYWKEPIKFYEKTFNYAPHSARMYNNLGNVYYENGEIEKAAALYKKAMELDSNYASAYYNLGNVYTKIGKREEAIILLEKAIEINPNFAKACYTLGNEYNAIGKREEAIELFKKVIIADPNFIDAYNNLGAAYYAIGKKEQAIELFKKALKINQNYALAHYNLAQIYYQQKKHDLAIRHCDKAIELGYKVNPKFLELLKPYRK